MQGLDQRHRPQASDCQAPIRRYTVDFALNCIELPDPLQSLGGNRRLIRHRPVEKRPPCVRQACSLKDRSVLVHPAVSGKAVGLQDASIIRQMRLRVAPAPIRRIAIKHRRRIQTAGRPVITDIGPDPCNAGFAAAGLEHRHRRIVGMQLFGGQDIPAQDIDQRIQQFRGFADPGGHGRAIQIDTDAPVDALLPVQGRVVGILGDHHLGQ
jgi:hypothetical protein